MKWRAWYTDYRVFDSAEYSWPEIPETGLLILIWYKPTGRTIYSGGDWYWLDTEHKCFKYIPSGDWGTWKPQPEYTCRSCIKQGVGVSDNEMRIALQEAWDYK